MELTCIVKVELWGSFHFCYCQRARERRYICLSPRVAYCTRHSEVSVDVMGVHWRRELELRK
jgi:hypothetical protein